MNQNSKHAETSDSRQPDGIATDKQIQPVNAESSEPEITKHTDFVDPEYHTLDHTINEEQPENDGMIVRESEWTNDLTHSDVSMTNNFSTDKLPVQPADKIYDDVLHKFEEDWKQKLHGKICSYLENVHLEHKPDLFIKMLEIELKYVKVKEGFETEKEYFNQFLSQKLMCDKSKYLQKIHQLLLPRIQFGNYQLIETIGKGGMGEIFLGKHKYLSKQNKLAIKVIRLDNKSHLSSNLPDFVPEDGSSSSSNKSSSSNRLSDAELTIRRFYREIEITSFLKSHKNVVSALDAGKTRDGVPFLTLEYIDGFDLKNVFTKYSEASSNKDVTGSIIKKKLPLGAVAEVIYQIADALKYAHNRNIIHRDIKPSNVMLTRDIKDNHEIVIKVLDWGISKNVSLQNIKLMDQDLTGGVAIGTAGYIAPELRDATGRLNDELQVSPQADIYSLGQVFGQMLLEKFDAPIINEDFSNKLKSSQIADPVISLYQKMTAFDRSKRYSSCDELQNDLKKYCKPHELLWVMEDIEGKARTPLPPSHNFRKFALGIATVLVLVAVGFSIHHFSKQQYLDIALIPFVRESNIVNQIPNLTPQLRKFIYDKVYHRAQFIGSESLQELDNKLKKGNVEYLRKAYERMSQTYMASLGTNRADESELHQGLVKVIANELKHEATVHDSDDEIINHFSEQMQEIKSVLLKYISEPLFKDLYTNHEQSVLQKSIDETLTKFKDHQADVVHSLLILSHIYEQNFGKSLKCQLSCDSRDQSQPKNNQGESALSNLRQFNRQLFKFVCDSYNTSGHEDFARLTELEFFHEDEKYFADKIVKIEDKYLESTALEVTQHSIINEYNNFCNNHLPDHTASLLDVGGSLCASILLTDNYVKISNKRDSEQDIYNAFNETINAFNYTISMCDTNLGDTTNLVSKSDAKFTGNDDNAHPLKSYILRKKADFLIKSGDYDSAYHVYKMARLGAMKNDDIIIDSMWSNRGEAVCKMMLGNFEAAELLYRLILLQNDHITKIKRNILSHEQNKEVNLRPDILNGCFTRLPSTYEYYADLFVCKSLLKMSESINSTDDHKPDPELLLEACKHYLESLHFHYLNQFHLYDENAKYTYRTWCKFKIVSNFCEKLGKPVTIDEGDRVLWWFADLENVMQSWEDKWKHEGESLNIGLTHNLDKRDRQGFLTYYTLKNNLQDISNDGKWIFSTNKAVNWLKYDNEEPSEESIKNNMYNRLPFLLLVLDGLARHSNYFENPTTKLDEQQYLEKLPKHLSSAGTNSSNDMHRVIDNIYKRINKK